MTAGRAPRAHPVRRWWTRARHAAAASVVYRNPVPRLLDYLGRVPRGAVREVRLWNGLRIAARLGTSDLSIVDEIFALRVYDRALRHVRPGHAVVDIGAHCGVFALAAALRGATVRCFEPLPANVALLRQNVRLNGFDARITAENVAVGPRAGTTALYVEDGNTGGSTFFPAVHPEWAGARRPGSIAVSCVTLREALTEPGTAVYDLVKMDCEGAEYEIVGQAEANDLARTRAFIMEYHPNGDVGALAHRLAAAGFAVDVARYPSVLYAVRSDA